MKCGSLHLTPGRNSSSRTFSYSFIHVKKTSTSNHNTGGVEGRFPPNPTNPAEILREESSSMNHPGKIDTNGADYSFQRKRGSESYPLLPQDLEVNEAVILTKIKRK
ncbi:hypothetical protein CDAR_80561 [Caerostris darwini]|uniref:Uncharacterized protein n=1 Tax=Caerostris darwini TaxID=1538125 RepID=A0AAV4SI63_9ARAC|nr:hypothetical protein CDAR_80561 [Caerostris darwini]